MISKLLGGSRFWLASNKVRGRAIIITNLVVQIPNTAIPGAAKYQNHGFFFLCVGLKTFFWQL